MKGDERELVVGNGGYASGPVVGEAARRGYKTARHEQKAYPGVANKWLEKEVGVVFAATESAGESLGRPQKTLVTGNPVRPELFTQDRDASRRGINAAGRTVLLSYGGSLGAMRVNEVVAELAAWHLQNRDFLHIHATGSIEKDDFARLAHKMGIEGNPNFEIREYIDNMPALLAAADLVISRAGALAVAARAAVGRASVLVPSPMWRKTTSIIMRWNWKRPGLPRCL